MEMKNNLLLTIIAIATLLVAVTGATFAYFTAQGGSGKLDNVSVETPKLQSATMTNGAVDPLIITAQQMEKSAANYKGYSTTTTTKPTVNFTSTGDGQKFCYTAKVKYNPSAKATGQAITYIDGHTTETGNNTENNKCDAGITTDGVEASYQDKLCSNEQLGLDIIKKHGVGESTTLSTIFTKHYDITGATASATEEEKYVKSDGTLVPISTNISEVKHEMSATGAGAQHDDWDIILTFYNHGYNQNTNSDKKATASIEFTQVDCY